MQQKTVRFQSFDLAPDHQPRPGALLRQMQQVAREHMAACGKTYLEMMEEGMVFIITRLAMQFHAPVPGETDLVLTTATNGIHGASFYRSFSFSDGEKDLVTAQTEWVLLDFKNRRLLRPTALKMDFPDDPVLCGGLSARRITAMAQGDLIARDERKVYFSMLDENDHLNNCVYADMVFDTLSRDVHPKELHINFLKEVREGQVLAITATQTPDGIVLQGDFAEGEGTSFRALVIPEEEQ